jgi:predicted transcriptional regulator
MNQLQKTLSVLLMSSLLLGLTSCAVTEYIKGKGVEAGGSLVADQLPEEEREEFTTKWEEDKGEAMKFAAKVIGEEKLAEQLLAAGEENAELAEQVRSGELWKNGSLALSTILALLGAFLKKREGTTAKVLKTLIGAVEVAKTSEAKPILLEAIKEKANADGTREALTREVNKTIAKGVAA